MTTQRSNSDQSSSISSDTSLANPKLASTRKLEQAFGLPGENGVWIIVFGDILIFSMMFGVFAYYRSLSAELFQSAQQSLSLGFGLTNTLVLLTSSWFMVWAIEAAKQNNTAAFRRLLLAVIVCGFVFVLFKVFEYSDKFAHDIYLTTNEFYMYYFAYTFIHCAHVVVGLGGLIYLIIRANKETFTDQDLINFESGATFWHMVDLLWIALFALLYLLPYQ